MLKLKEIKFRKSWLIKANSLLISSLLPFLASYPGLASSCDSTMIDSQVQKLAKLDQEQFDALAKCGASAVLALIEALKDNDQEVRWRSAYALGLIGPESHLAIQPLIKALSDANNNSTVRSQVAVSLGDIQSNDEVVISALLKALQVDPDYEVRAGAAYSLGAIRATRREVILELINVLDIPDDEEVRRFAARALGQIAEQERNSVQPYAPQTLIRAIRSPNQDLSVLVECVYALGAIQETSDAAIDALIASFNSQPSELRIQSALALAKISEFLNAQADTRQDIKAALPVVVKIQSELGESDLSTEPEIRQSQEAIAIVLQNLRNKQKVLLNEQIMIWLAGGRAIWLAHATFWILLVFVYPKSRPIQAIFFWNPWVRKIFGLGYVNFFLTWIPFLRRRLFEPFQRDLLADARLETFTSETYFPDSQVKLETNLPSETQELMAISEAIPEIRGRIILEGKSGLGKTTFLRYMLKGYEKKSIKKTRHFFPFNASNSPIKRSNQIAVYLPTTECADGVIEAIQKKLHGDEIKDPKFLQSLLYSGAIDICIDGLNEASPDTRAKITEFIRSYSKGNILIATQPLSRWKPPANTKIYSLQPLQPNQIINYLLSRQSFLSPKAPVQGEDYERACQAFLEDSLRMQGMLSSEEQEKVQIVLSNPLELSLAALMLANGNSLKLQNLREQQYTIMAEDYHKTWNKEFPIKSFSEAVYHLWLDEKVRRTLPAEDFPNEVELLADEKFRMAISRQWQDKGNEHKEWSFRHDKIAEFFIAQTFRDRSDTAKERITKHMGDTSFSGVYLLLATILPEVDAYQLREDLIQYSAKTGDHTVSDAYVRLLPPQ